MALTLSQRELLRLDIGDNETTYMLTDAQLDAMFDTANEDTTLTRVIALRALCGISANKADLSNAAQFGTAQQSSTRYTRFVALRDYWEGLWLEYGNATYTTTDNDGLEGLAFLDMGIDDAGS